MIEALNNEQMVDRVGGRFKLCVLIQRRLVELMDGSRPLVERDGRSDLEIAIDEIAQGKITIAWDEKKAFEEAATQPTNAPKPLL